VIITGYRGKFSAVKRGSSLVVIDEGSKQLGSVSGAMHVSSLNAYNTIEVGGHSYRGAMEVRSDGKNTLVLINVLDVENYLRGVLPYEMPAKEREILEALKAQAVAARTYAMAHQNQYSRGFDMYADERDQVYRGIEAETFLSDKAVDATRGILLTHNHSLVNCYYHSTCGGHTTDIDQVWEKEATAYLIGIADTGLHGHIYCSASRHASWSESWDQKRLAEIIRRHQKSAGVFKTVNFFRLNGLQIEERTPCGRAKKLKILTDKGPIVVKSDKIRWALRRETPKESILKSTWFEIEQFGARVTIRGKGMGHGVGMCQTGAMGRARSGQTFVDILNAYYQQTQLVQWSN
jgi:stage II sporulation protein D